MAWAPSLIWATGNLEDEFTLGDEQKARYAYPKNMAIDLSAFSHRALSQQWEMGPILRGTLLQVTPFEDGTEAVIAAGWTLQVVGGIELRRRPFSP